MYRDDLAYIQHHGFSDFAAGASAGLLSLFRRAGITSGHVLDLGCGDGTWLRLLIQQGFTATGIDRSAALLTYARAAAPTAVIKRGSAYASAFPRCHAITALGEVFSYVPVSRSRGASLGALFRRAHAALEPGGLLVFDVLVSGPPLSYRTSRSGPSWAVLAEISERHHRVHRRIVTFRRLRGQYRRRTETHTLRVFTRSAILHGLRRAGFVVSTSRHYGRFELAERRLAFIAHKPRRPG